MCVKEFVADYVLEDYAGRVKPDATFAPCNSYDYQGSTYHVVEHVLSDGKCFCFWAESRQKHWLKATHRYVDPVIPPKEISALHFEQSTATIFPIRCSSESERIWKKYRNGVAPKIYWSHTTGKLLNPNSLELAVYLENQDAFSNPIRLVASLIFTIAWDWEKVIDDALLDKAEELVREEEALELQRRIDAKHAALKEAFKNTLKV